MNKSLTRSQKVVLATIQDLINKLGKSPTLDEIREALKYSSISSVQRHVDAIKSKGYLTNEKYQNRSLEVTGDTVNIPLVGNIAAGRPIYAEENIEAYIPYPSSKVHSPVKDFFFLRAVGDSMNATDIKGENIDDGDFVLVKQTNSADFGDRVVALIGEEATIKKLVEGEGYIRLEPESSNPDNKPIILFDDFSVQGVIIDVIKRGGVNLL